jgi:hypothetical protein
MRHHRFRRASAIGIVLLFTVMSSCGTSSTDGPDQTDVVDSTPVSDFEPAKPTLSGVPETFVVGPITGGSGQVVLGTDAFDGSVSGYTEAEYFVAGTAQSYKSSNPLSDDGQWSVEANDSTNYTTRIVVRRPSDPALFNGTVFVEWLNVTAGLDIAPVWSYANVEMMRSGAIWVGVSAQRVGVEGGGNPLGETRVLKVADPARYGTLIHPGDNYSYDIFSQAGATVWRNADLLFDGLTPERVIAMGESQSAFRMVTYINAVSANHDVYHGYLVHSRGSRGAALSADPGPDVPGPTAARIRADFARPVLTLTAETDVVGDALGYRRASQPDTDTFRSWEVAGTAHADAYSLGIGDTDDGSGVAGSALFDAMLNAPTGVYGGLINCDLPINAGPHTYVVRSALVALDNWVRTGNPAPSMPQLTVNADLTGFEEDANGNVLGGVRTPHVDVPVAKLSGLGQVGTGFCFLFGTTTPFTKAQLARLYVDKADFVAKWREATDRAITAGAILEADRAEIIASAERYPE